MQANQQQPHATDEGGDVSRALFTAQAELKERDGLPPKAALPQARHAWETQPELSSEAEAFGASLTQQLQAPLH